MILAGHSDRAGIRFASELVLRRRIRSSLHAWCVEALAPTGYVPALHHKVLIRELEDVAAGNTPRLMIFMPPGSAKSTYTSDLFPAWFLAQRASLNVIGASNTQTLAEAFSRRVRGRVRTHGHLLGYRMDREAEDLWTTTTGGQYRAAGVGGVITGLRADLGIIDDPVKSREEADSPGKRQRAWEWYEDDFTTRLKPDAAQVIMCTRWHEDDLPGRILERQPGLWKVLRVPAICDDADDPLHREIGEWLWADDEYGFADDLRKKQRTASGRSWSAMYQQRPVAASGDFFRADWLKTGTAPPRSGMRVYGASDYAVSDGEGDFTVHLVVGIDREDRLWVLDVWRRQAGSEAWVEAFCDLVQKWKPIGWAEENGQIRAGIGPWLSKRQRERGAWVARQQFPTKHEKSIRAQSIRGRMALSGIYLPHDAHWRADLEGELLSFPAGKRDDQVDALGLVGQLLDVMVGPGAEARAPEEVPSDYGRGRSRTTPPVSWKCV